MEIGSNSILSHSFRLRQPKKRFEHHELTIFPIEEKTRPPHEARGDEEDFKRAIAQSAPLERTGFPLQSGADRKSGGQFFFSKVMSP